MMQEAIEDCSGGRHVAQELAPVFQRAVAGHDGRAVFVAADDHFQQVFAGAFRQRFESHVVDDDQVGFKVFTQRFLLMVEGFIAHEVAHKVENGPVKHLLALFDGFIAQCLSEMRFPYAGRPEEEDVMSVVEVAAGSQLEDLPPVDGGVKLPVEVFECFKAAEIRGFGAAAEVSLLAYLKLVVEDQLEKFAMGKAAGSGFGQAHVEGLHQPREAQLAQGVLDLDHVFCWCWFAVCGSTKEGACSPAGEAIR